MSFCPLISTNLLARKIMSPPFFSIWISFSEGQSKCSSQGEQGLECLVCQPHPLSIYHQAQNKAQVNYRDPISLIRSMKLVLSKQQKMNSFQSFVYLQREKQHAYFCHVYVHTSVCYFKNPQYIKIESLKAYNVGSDYIPFCIYIWIITTWQ